MALVCFGIGNSVLAGGQTLGKRVAKVRVVHGFDIGFASSSPYQSYGYAPEEWMKELEMARL